MSATGAELISAERGRQAAIGFDAQHDALHINGEIAMAAACIAAPEKIFVKREIPWRTGTATLHADPFPWEKEYDARIKHDRIKQLVIAGALIAAEIDRLQAQK